HFDTGDYTYTAPDVTGAPIDESFIYTIVDGDGSTASAALEIEVTDSGVSVINPHLVLGSADADSLAGGAGSVDDIMSDAPGNDRVSGGHGNDHIQGGNDNDSLVGGGGIDVLIGGAGADTLDGGPGADVLVGGDGNDRITVGTGDSVDGGDGNDLFLLTDNTG